jgi:hypothetical protein
MPLTAEAARQGRAIHYKSGLRAGQFASGFSLLSLMQTILLIELLVNGTFLFSTELPKMYDKDLCLMRFKKTHSQCII